MPEGVAAGGVVITPESSDRPAKPAPSADAPRGWTWSRDDKKWVPKVRGKVLYQDGAGSPSEPVQDAPAGVSRSDPDPGWLEDKPPKKKLLASQKVKDDLEGALGLLGMIVLPPIVKADPLCGGAIAENWDSIAVKCIPLICRSELVVRYLTDSDGGFMDWFGLAVALKPVGSAILQHHIYKSVKVVTDEKGDKYAVDADYSEYTTEPVAA